MKPAKKRPVHPVNGPWHKCRCRRLVWLPSPISPISPITTCLCGERYQWAKPKAAVKTIVIGGKEKKKEEDPVIMKEEKK